MAGDAGAAIRGGVLGYLVVYRGLVPRVAGVAIAGLPVMTGLSFVFRDDPGGRSITAFSVWGLADE
jgi:hypothetical protein